MSFAYEALQLERAEAEISGYIRKLFPDVGAEQRIESYCREASELVDAFRTTNDVDALLEELQTALLVSLMLHRMDQIRQRVHSLRWPGENEHADRP